MDYINYGQMEKMLRLYLDICKKTKELQEIKDKICENDMDDRIYSLVIGNKELTGMPFPSAGNTSDKTAKVALSFRDNFKINDSEALRQMDWELGILENVISKIDMVYKELPLFWKKIIFGKYYNCPCKTWREIAKDCRRDLSKSTLQSYRRQAISRFCKDAKISDNLYNSVLEVMKKED